MAYENAPIDSDGKKIVWARFKLNGVERYGRVLLEDSDEHTLTVRLAVNADSDPDPDPNIHSRRVEVDQDIVRVAVADAYIFYPRDWR